jgi:hypothetical protein
MLIADGMCAVLKRAGDRGSTQAAPAFEVKSPPPLLEARLTASAGVTGCRSRSLVFWLQPPTPAMARREARITGRGREECMGGFRIGVERVPWAEYGIT